MWDFDKQGILASAVEMVSLQNENTEWNGKLDEQSSTS
jgi:hypothetical protein